jgi:hypothetical protein
LGLSGSSETSAEGSAGLSECSETFAEGSAGLSGTPDIFTKDSAGVSECSATGNGLLPTPGNEKAISYQKPVMACVCVWKERGSEEREKPKSL